MKTFDGMLITVFLTCFAVFLCYFSRTIFLIKSKQNINATKVVGKVKKNYLKLPILNDLLNAHSLSSILVATIYIKMNINLIQN